MAGLRRQSDPDLGEAEERPPLARLFAQDFRRVDDEQEESAARERVRSLDHVPAFLLGVHLDLRRRLPGRVSAARCTPSGAARRLARRRSSPSTSGSGPGCAGGRSARLAPHVAIRGAALYSLVAYALVVRGRLRRRPGRGDLDPDRHRGGGRRARLADRLPLLSRAGGDRLRRLRRQIPLPVRTTCSARRWRSCSRSLLVRLSLKALGRPHRPAPAPDRDRLARRSGRRASSRSSSRPAAAGSGRRPRAAPSPTSPSSSPRI